MTQAVVASLPVESRCLPSCVESILDKKVAGVALNTLESLLDWLLSWIYCPYQICYREKMERIHRFSDATVRLFDATQRKVASIEHDWGDENDFIKLNGQKVLFNPDPQIDKVFTHQTVQYVVVKEGSHRGWYQIEEHEQGSMEKRWEVDTTKPLRQVGPLQGYLVERPRPSSPR